FSTDKNFCSSFVYLLKKSLESQKKEKLLSFFETRFVPQSFIELSTFLSDFVRISEGEVVLLIDEVDRASNFSIFLQFLGMLRSKYLNQLEGLEVSFQSVVLAGVHDIKNIKLSLRSEEEKQYNSPWNIAAEFDVDMSFSSEEISSMLKEYAGEHGLEIDILQLSQEIYKYSSGYPYLVSSICKIIDEKLEKDWTSKGIQKAISKLLEESNTLFDDLIKNVENHSDISELLHSILIDDAEITYNPDHSTLSKSFMYGIIKKDEMNKVAISNKIFEIRLYNYYSAQLEISKYSNFKPYAPSYKYFDEKGILDMSKVLLRFQDFIQGNYSDKDGKFYERQGRLLLIAFIKPIINGHGFYYVESQHSYERRSDLIISYGEKEYILELKVWYGEKYHEEGLEQLATYLKSRGQKEGYLAVFNFNKKKEFTSAWREVRGKRIFEVML
ncbi:MAG: hypothetical protein KDK45_07585, partial [Leptospiraceae bacterium]|nr:hypothetical protein [Leptospiraceae bacterium]